MENQQKSQTSDEIDLIELLTLLWKKKVIIIATTFICVVIAAIYAFTAKEQWTSKAEVIAPNAVSLNNYLTIRREYARILGSDFDVNSLSNSLFSKFNQLMYSLDEREHFLSQSEVYKLESAGKDEEQQRVILNKLARENITITKPDAKKDPDAIGIKISFAAEKPVSAQDTLKAFIKKISQESLDYNFKSFLIDYNEKLGDLRFQFNQIKQNANIQRKVKLENLNRSLDTAKQAGIKDYSRSFGGTETNLLNVIRTDTSIPLSESPLSDNPYLFILGEKYITAQIDSIEQSNIIYPPKYYQIQEQITQLEALAQKFKEAKLETDAYTYLSSPDYPVVKDKPKRLLIVVAGMLIGLILSIIYVLVTSAFISRKKEIN
ncbi:Lipopolysaccharide biosynthesis protein wzzE [Gallibacterium anatis]|uniref:Lipopolysaccharide biosynthesis protein wzzE n=1 Tax=Gallibacterium anatis TaxID=750 RepID=A0A377H666_9PAST|nr:Wzz/FepE/Etk N-terminal domain-containing protein [Gallibacterium anatis]KGQ59106.1 Wzz [Gallibacterium anatis DSM 16844 = F 149]STO38106.1 Lipopolysaccharide biosynthesis protein wzzE [Gallibacterium anatis]